MEKTPEAIAAISDPGEVGRAGHNRGDRFIVGVSNIFAWVYPLLMVVIVAQVILRSAGHNQAWMDDLQWWLYGVAVLVGIAYAATTNSHVRVDIFYDHYDAPKQYRTEILALAWCFLPFILVCWDVTLHYAISSVQIDEGSSSPNGLHNLWILKIAMNVSFALIAVAAWSAYLRYLSKLTKPVLWKQLFYALPTTAFAMNLAVYYVLWWGVWLTSPEGTNARQVGRHALFDDFEFGAYDIKYTVVISLVLTAVVIGLARALSRGDAAKG